MSDRFMEVFLGIILLCCVGLTILQFAVAFELVG